MPQQQQYVGFGFRGNFLGGAYSRPPNVTTLSSLKSLIILASGGHPPSTATIVCLSVNNFFCGLGTICKWTANSLKYALIWGTHFVWSVLYAKKTRKQWLLSTTTVGTVLSFKKFRPFWYVRNDIEGHFILQKSISIKE